MFRRKFGATNRILLSLMTLVLFAGSVLFYQRVYATPPTGGITATKLASATLPDAVKAKFKEAGTRSKKATEVSDLSIVKYTAPAGASFGWHKHSGPIWVLITAGTLTYYRVDHSKCLGESYSAGSAFFDPGNDTHIARNESGETVELYAVYMLPQGGPARIDEPDPGVCTFK